jgi:hypothetical protein
VGGLKASDASESAAGEGDRNPRADAPIEGDTNTRVGPKPAGQGTPPHRHAARLPVASKRGGLALLVVSYVLATAALAYAIYERFVA